MPRKPKTGDSKARILLRKHIISQSPDNLFFAEILYGPRVGAEEYLRRYKAACKRDGRRYRREDAITEAAKYFGLDGVKLTNWLNRSKKVSRR
jgi:hypothetical protein